MALSFSLFMLVFFLNKENMYSKYLESNASDLINNHLKQIRNKHMNKLDKENIKC